MSLNLKEHMERSVVEAVIDGVIRDLKNDPEHNLDKAIARIASLADKVSFLPVFKS